MLAAAKWLASSQYTGKFEEEQGELANFPSPCIPYVKDQNSIAEHKHGNSSVNSHRKFAAEQRIRSNEFSYAALKAFTYTVATSAMQAITKALAFSGHDAPQFYRPLVAPFMAHSGIRRPLCTILRQFIWWENMVLCGIVIAALPVEALMFFVSALRGQSIVFHARRRFKTVLPATVSK